MHKARPEHVLVLAAVPHQQVTRDFHRQSDEEFPRFFQ